MEIREQTEQKEKEFLSKYATKSINATRQRDEKPCPYRTAYQRDRDRILHSKSFRRLMHKTQVFLSPEGDHYTTRLTHSLEVAQIARTLARALELNEDLTEAIALGHDLGHTPFGHSGEKALDEVLDGKFSFEHSEQSVRVVTSLEKDGKGLNLTTDTLDGIANHSLASSPKTPEGNVVRLSDKIAYLSHDADDAIRAGIITNEDIPKHIREVLGENKSARITTFIGSIIDNSKDGNISFSDDIEKVFREFRTFMFNNVYLNPSVKAEEEKAISMLKTMFCYYIKNPDKLPSEVHMQREIDGLERAVCDYISGMTDRFAISLYDELFIPKSWSLTFKK